jgi:hypothetical protein
MKTFFASKTSRLTTPLGWLFVYLLLVQGTLPSLVLCFGSGGHIAVETPHSPVSHSTPQSQGPCLDVFLHVEKPEAHPFIVTPGAASHTLIPILAHAAAVLPWGTASPSPEASRYSGLSPLLPLAPLSPVILRI